MVKTYLRYVPGGTYGVIASPAASIDIDPTGQMAFCGALENVGVWHVKRGVEVHSLASSSAAGDYSSKPEATCIVCSPRGKVVAVGYADGMIRLFDYTKMTLTTVLNGHRKAVTCMAFSPTGMNLVSGSRDTTVILWDLVAEAGVCRFRGHKDEVTDVAFLPPEAASASAVAAAGASAAGAACTLVASCSKDTLVKVWDVSARLCIQTFVGARAELWSLAVLPATSSTDATGASVVARLPPRLVAAGSDNLLRVWSLGAAGTGGSAAAADSSSVGSAASAVDDAGAGIAAGGVLSPVGNIVRQTHERGARVRYMHVASVSTDTAAAGAAAGSASADASGTPTGVGLLVLQSTGKTLEVYRRRAPAEVRRRVLRRLRRQREKLRQKERNAAAAAASSVSASGGLDADGDDPMGLYGLAGAGGAAGDADDVGALAGATLAELDAYIARVEAEASGAVAGAAAGTGKGGKKDAAVAASAAATAAVASAGAAGGDPLARIAVASDELELVGIVQSSAKAASFCMLPLDAATATSPSSAALSLLISTGNNTLEVHTLPLTPAACEALGATTVTTPAGLKVPLALHSRTIAQQGHRSDVRAVCVSSDGALVLTGSTGHAKVWNPATGSCVRTLELPPVTAAAAGGGGDGTGAAGGATSSSASTTTSSAVALCVGFGPGNRHALVGTKDGRLLLFDLASGDLLESHAAHNGCAVWSLTVRPDFKGLATGGADKEVRFWDFDLTTPDAAGAASGKKGAAAAPAAAASAGGFKQLTLVHARTLKLADEVLSVKYSHHSDPTRVLIAVALLDATVKIFFEDTLRFFTSLYGHKLPVMAMDISADNSLIVTASADKNVKIWGLDYGDCHKSFFAHEDSVMSVAFLAKTHYFFTAGKDRVIKYWDGDRFEHIHSLEGHKGELWALATAPDGSYLVSGGHDRSLRIWRRSEEQVFLDEEREREAEAMVAKDAAARDPDGDLLLGASDAVGPLGPDGMAKPSDLDMPVSAAPIGGAGGLEAADATTVIAHSTKDTVKGTDRLLEALKLASEESDKWAEYAEDVAAAVAAGDDPSTVTPPPRNPSLIGLTPSAFILRTLRAIRPSDIDQVLMLLAFPDAMRLLQYLHHLLRKGHAVELVVKATLLLLRVHNAQIVSNQTLLPLVVSVKDAMHAAIAAHTDRVGYNTAALKTIQQALASSGALAIGDRPARVDKGGKEIRAGKRRKVRIF